jgi:hypothetical protein
MSSLTQLNRFVVMTGFADLCSVSRARERLGREERSQRLLSIVGKSSGSRAAGPAADAPLVSQSSPTV